MTTVYYIWVLLWLTFSTTQPPELHTKTFGTYQQAFKYKTETLDLPKESTNVQIVELQYSRQVPQGPLNVNEVYGGP